MQGNTFKWKVRVWGATAYTWQQGAGHGGTTASCNLVGENICRERLEVLPFLPPSFELESVDFTLQ